MRQKESRLFDWSAKSPYLNPFKHLWYTLKTSVNKSVKLDTTRGGEGRGGEGRVERPIIKKVGRYRPGKKGISFRSGDCVPRLTAMVDTFGTECFDGSDLRG